MLSISTQTTQPHGLHESRKAAFDAHTAGAALTAAQTTICRAATLGLYAGQDSGGLWWVQCPAGWATGASQADINAYSAACLVEVSTATTAEPLPAFFDLVAARARWAGLNYFKRPKAEPGSLMFATPPTWAYDFDYGLTCGFPEGHFRARAIHPTSMKNALDALGVPASV